MSDKQPIEITIFEYGEDIGTIGIALYAALSSFAYEENTKLVTTISLRALSHAIGSTKQSVLTYLRTLQKFHIILIERATEDDGGSSINCYILNPVETWLLSQTRFDVDGNPIPPAYKKKVISNTLRRLVFERDAYRCNACGCWEDLTADHIIPEIKGGPTTLENLQTLCRSCNTRKKDRV